MDKIVVIAFAAAALAACVPDRADTNAAPAPGAAPPAAAAPPPPPGAPAASGQPAGTAAPPAALKEEDRSPFSRPKFEVRPPEPQRWYSTGRRYE